MSRRWWGIKIAKPPLNIAENCAAPSWILTQFPPLPLVMLLLLLLWCRWGALLLIHNNVRSRITQQPALSAVPQATHYFALSAQHKQQQQRQQLVSPPVLCIDLGQFTSTPHSLKGAQRLIQAQDTALCIPIAGFLSCFRDTHSAAPHRHLWHQQGLQEDNPKYYVA